MSSDLWQDERSCKNVSISISADSAHKNVSTSISADSAHEGEEVEHVLTGLTPSSVYSIRVAAATRAGEGPYSLETEGTTGDECKWGGRGDIGMGGLYIGVGGRGRGGG